MAVIKPEKENLMFKVNGEKPSIPYIEILVKDVQEDFLFKIKSVVGAISELDKDNWPSDNYFESNLPKWFVDITKKNSFEFINANPNLFLWHFGSWIDAMKARNWVWFSSLKTPDGVTINIDTFDYPYIIEPLEYMIRATGDVKNYIITEHTKNSNDSQEWKFKNSMWQYN